jgi:hypothetical protein
LPQPIELAALRGCGDDLPALFREVFDEAANAGNE